MMSRPRSRSERRLLAVLAAAVAVLLQLAIYDRWFGLLDEGYMLALAEDIRRGHVLYRDVYVDAPLPAAFYLLAGWFTLLGSSVWASRLLAVGLFAGLVGVVVRIAAEVLPRLGVLAVFVLLLCYRLWAFPHWQVYSYSSLAATAASAAALLVLTATARPRRLLVAGVLAGVAILSKQDYGLAVAGALGLAVLLRPLLFHTRARPEAAARALGAFVGGGALVVVPTLAAFGLAGALPALVRQSLLVPLRGAESGTYPGLPPILPLFGQDPVLREKIGSYLPSILLTLRWEAIAASHAFRETPLWDVGLKLVYYAPLALWTLAAVVWGVGAARATGPAKVRRAERRLVLLAWAGGFLLAFNRPRDWVHLMMVYPPFLVLGPVLVRDLARRLPVAAGALVVAPALAAVAALGVVTAPLAGELRAAFTVPLDDARGGVFTDARHGPIVHDVLAWIDAHARPDAPVPVYPEQPMLGFLAGRETAGGFHVIWPFQAADRDERIIADLEARHVDTMVYSLSQYAHLGTFRDNAPRLYRHLVDHYRIATTFTHERFGPLLVGLERVPPAVLAPLPLRTLVADGDGAARAVRWPFTEALALPIGTPDAPRAFTRRLRIPPGPTELDFDYGVNPERWLTLPPGAFTFRVSVAGTPLFHGVLDPSGDLADRRWASGHVAFTHTGDEAAAITFAVEGPAAFAGDDDLAGFARLRVASGG